MVSDTGGQKNASETGGVKAFSIQGRLYRERERLIGMTEKERNWRRQWIKDQVLVPGEPKFVPELHKELNNPIRRMYRKPLDKLADLLTPVMGREPALFTRHLTGKILMFITGVYMTAYYFKYNANDWTRTGGWRVLVSRPSSFPGEKNYKAPPERTKPSDYSSRGFENSPI